MLGLHNWSMYYVWDMFKDLDSSSWRVTLLSIFSFQAFFESRVTNEYPIIQVSSISELSNKNGCETFLDLGESRSKFWSRHIGSGIFIFRVCFDPRFELKTIGFTSEGLIQILLKWNLIRGLIAQIKRRHLSQMIQNWLSPNKEHHQISHNFMNQRIQTPLMRDVSLSLVEHHPYVWL